MCIRDSVTSVRNLCRELEKKGHAVRILTLSESVHSYREGNVTYVRSLPLDAVYPNVRMATTLHHRLIRELIDWQPDVIHSQCEFFTFQFALYVSKHTGAPIVHTYHSLYEQYVTYVLPSKRLGKTLVRVLSKKRLRRVKAVIAPTEKVGDALRAYGLRNDIRIVPSLSLIHIYRPLYHVDRRQASTPAAYVKGCFAVQQGISLPLFIQGQNSGA